MAIELIIQGVLLGLLLSIMVGPVFFVLIETSIIKGIRAAMLFDFGVLLSDLLYVYLAYTFYSEAAFLLGNNQYFRVVGGLVFIVFGVFNIFKKLPRQDQGKIFIPEYNHSFFKSLQLISKGFVLNAINPGVIFYWMTIISVGGVAASPEEGEIEKVSYIFVGAILVTFFSIDILKIIGAKKLKPFLTPKILQIINMLTGVILCAAGMMYILNGILRST